MNSRNFILTAAFFGGCFATAAGAMVAAGGFAFAAGFAVASLAATGAAARRLGQMERVVEIMYNRPVEQAPQDLWFPGAWGAP